MSSEVMLFALFDLGGHPSHSSPVLSLMGKRGTIGGSLQGVAYHSQSYLPLFHSWFLARGSIPFPIILTTFPFLILPLSHLLGNVVLVTCTPKRHVPHSLMRRRG
jgi:hypothetical protein